MTIVMQFVAGVAHAAQPPSVVAIVFGLLAHGVFFGIPVACYIAFANKRQLFAA